MGVLYNYVIYKKGYNNVTSDACICACEHCCVWTEVLWRAPAFHLRVQSSPVLSSLTSVKVQINKM